MNKKGIIPQIGVSIFMLVLTIYGTFSSLEQGEQSIYVGDTDSGLVYDYSICRDNVENIDEENLILFNNIRQIENNNNFEFAEGCY